MSWCLTKYKITHCGNCPNPYTNYDKIRKMTVDEMINFLQEIADSYLLKKDIETWLLQEVEE